MHYVEYKNMFDEFVNKYNVLSFNISPIKVFKNELVHSLIVTME
jgi:hypothetical protein